MFFFVILFSIFYFLSLTPFLQCTKASEHLPDSPVSLKRIRSHKDSDDEEDDELPPSRFPIVRSTAEPRRSILKASSRPIIGSDSEEEEEDKEEYDYYCDNMTKRRGNRKTEEEVEEVESIMSGLALGGGARPPPMFGLEVKRARGTNQMFPTIMCVAPNSSGQRLVYIEQQLLSGSTADDYGYKFSQNPGQPPRLTTTYKYSQKQCPPTSRQLFQHAIQHKRGIPEKAKINWFTARQGHMTKVFQRAYKQTSSREILYKDVIELPFQVEDIFDNTIQHVNEACHIIKKLAYTGDGMEMYLLKSYFILCEQRKREDLDIDINNALREVDATNISVDQME